MLRSDISRLLVRSNEAMDRGDVDDPPPAILPHMGNRVLRGMERAAQINGEDLIPLLLGEILDIRGELDPRVIHQDIEPPVLFHGEIN